MNCRQGHIWQDIWCLCIFLKKYWLIWR